MTRACLNCQDAAVETPVDGCRHCGIPMRSTRDNSAFHARRWVAGVGWHGWTAPTQEQIKARMIARRAARITAEPPFNHDLNGDHA